MDWLELLYQILELCIIPLLGVLTTFAVKFFKAKEVEIQSKIDDETTRKYIGFLFDTISDCVCATTQTYVDTLKKEGKFDGEAQKNAFNMTYAAVMNQLTDDAKEFLTEVYGDLSAFVIAKIESEVKRQK